MFRMLSAVGIGLLLTIALVAGEPEKPSQRRISVEEIQDSVVIGRLGVPLGEIVTVKLRWEPTFKPFDTAFVTEVDGRKLDPPVEFWDDMPTTPNANAGFDVPKYEYKRDYRFRVYESAIFWGGRGEWEKERGDPSMQWVGFALLSEIEILREAPAAQRQSEQWKPTRQSKPRITIEEIQDSIVVGKLGIPLGDVATIVGRWEIDETRKAGEQLVVSEINGRRLAKPLQFSGSPPTLHSFYGDEHHKLQFDRTYRLRVYESAGFTGIRPEWFKESGEAIPAAVGYSFQSDISVLRDITSGQRLPRNEPSDAQ